MFFLRQPSPETIQAFLASQSKDHFTYEAIGATQGRPPAGYVVDHTRTKLGQGEEVFNRGKEVLQRWGQFDLGWVRARPSETPLRGGEVVAVVARLFGVWWLSACRIIYVVDENEPVTRYGFGYGTLPDHAGTGEERFLIEWNRETDEVWYDILAFSRPQWLVARIGYPYMRGLQRRFGRESSAAMVKAVQRGAGGQAS